MRDEKGIKLFFDFLLSLENVFKKYERFGLFRKSDIYSTFNRVIETRDYLDYQDSLFKKEIKPFDRTNKELLIGILPSIMASTKYFPSNEDINIFAKKNLGIRIPQADKKSRPDLIGRIISEIVDMPELEVSGFRKKLEEAIERTKNVKGEEFYRTWSRVIKNLRLK